MRRKRNNLLYGDGTVPDAIASAHRTAVQAAIDDVRVVDAHRHRAGGFGRLGTVIPVQQQQEACQRTDGHHHDRLLEGGPREGNLFEHVFQHRDTDVARLCGCYRGALEERKEWNNCLFMRTLQRTQTQITVKG